MMGAAEKAWPGTEAEQDFAKYLVANHGAHFVTVVRRGVGRLLGVSIPRQTIVVKELMDAASASTLESLQRENDELRQRLDIGPCGEDAIDVAESAADHLRHRAEAAEAEVKRQADNLSWYRSGSFAHAVNEHLADAGISINGDILHDCIRRTALASTGGEHHAE
ncbi:hypothetical protein [Agrobacterium pusense]|uniref:Uncharacterized protein n=1 Tax=Agrobacterium pusense TaxID=648995 RepID=A0AA44ER43_9HYPH|nr:hypothetical protein [Agrobacterium pusense]NRF12450.1 hypothetical protein [Agrobacterium pusense]NRF23160.1 hypothetical protein [Agrobacterium pusense]